jgi:hypothetical protein
MVRGRIRVRVRVRVRKRVRVKVKVRVRVWVRAAKHPYSSPSSTVKCGVSAVCPCVRVCIGGRRGGEEGEEGEDGVPTTSLPPSSTNSLTSSLPRSDTFPLHNLIASDGMLPLPSSGRQRAIAATTGAYL